MLVLALENIIHNAIKYSPAGSEITVVTSTREKVGGKKQLVLETNQKKNLVPVQLVPQFGKTQAQIKKQVNLQSSIQ